MTSPYAQLEGQTPLVSDRFIITLMAGAAVTMGQLLYLNGTDFTVAPSTGSQSLTTIIGVAMATRAKDKTVPIATMGIVRVKAYGAIAAGDQICSASGGTAGVGLIESDTQGPGAKNSSVIGQALQAIASGATGLVILW